MLKRLGHHLFFRKITIAKWQLNVWALLFLSFGLVFGGFFTGQQIGKILAANDTVKTWSINNTTSSNFTSHGGVSFGASGATIANQFTNPGFESGTTGWTAFSQESSTVVGTGTDGAITISTTKTIDTDTIATGRSFADGVNIVVGTEVATGSASLQIFGNQTSVGFAANDEALILNVQGLSSNYNRVGQYETVTISSISYSSITGFTTFSFNSNLTYGYDGTTQKIIMQRVPHYTNVTIQSGGILTASAWNGTKGGVLFFRASGTVDVQAGGSIDVSYKGYRKGAGSIPAWQGESYAGPGTQLNTANFGGGGGGNTAVSGNGSGGGGAYATNGGNSNYQPGYGGTAYGQADLSTIFFGSGGGGNHGDSVAGSGGGIIYIGTNIISISGTIAANGQGGGCHHGSGGSAAGGSIYIRGFDVSIGSSLVSAVGLAPTGCNGNIGGTGGNGRIRIDGVVTGTSNPTYYGGTYSTTNALAYTSTYSMKVISQASSVAYLTQSFNIGDTNSYQLTAYVYDGTTGNIGGTVSSSIAQLFYNGSLVTTTYTNAGSGWWRLDGTITGANASRVYGLAIPAGKTVYVDSVGFPTRTSFYVTTAHNDTQVSSFDSFCEGTISGGVCTTTSTKPTGTEIYYQICTDDVATCQSGSSWQYYTGSAWSNVSNITSDRNTAAQLTSSAMQALPVTNHKIAIKVIFETNNESAPLLSSVAIGYTTDTTAPTSNASSPSMKRSTSGTTVVSNDWTKNDSPYFSWTAGADNGGGSGVRGYCLYLGTDSSGNPATSKGLLGTSPGSLVGSTCQFIVPSTSVDFATSSFKGSTWLTTSSSPYFLNIKVLDNAGNVYTGASTQFQFRYDATAPTNVAYTSCASGNFSNVVDMSFSWPTSGGSGSSDSNSDVLGWQYQINSTSGSWLGTTSSLSLGINYIPTSSSTYTLSNGQDGGSIISGANVIYFRTIDNAGNTSPDATVRTCNISYGGAAPSFGGVDSVTITPSTNTENSYALSWPAATASGSNAVAGYYYMINTPPPSTYATLIGNEATYIPNGTSRTVAVGSLPNVNKGTNTVYVVAVDNADTPNYSPSNYISGTFTLNSTDPDNVGNLVASDSSIKSSSQWNVTLTWTAPAYQGAGNLTYLVKRSTDGTTFTQVGTTSGLSYVDNTPSSTLYYYKIVTKDGANATSSGTNAVSITPTGKWTVPPDLESGPTVSSITTRKATITWSTSRTADSKVAYGTSAGSYNSVEPSNADQVTSHSIALSGLSPGVAYHYKVKWTDEDGNTGESEEKTFSTAPAPVMEDAQATNVGISSALISFTATGATKVKLYYGTSTTFGGATEISTSTSATKYTIQLDGLLDDTKYYFKLNGYDSENEEYQGTVLTFATLPRPKISNVRIQEVKRAANPTMLVTWDTNTDVSSIVTYYPEGNAKASQDQVDVARIKGSHRALIKSLLPNTPYLLVIGGVDKIGNEALSDSQRFTTSTDTRPPLLSSLNVEGSTTKIKGAGENSTAQLVVSWNSDEPSTSQVEFGEGSTSNYAQQTQEDKNLTVNHIVIISGLTPSKVYHLRALSKDKANNQGRSVDVVTIAPKQTNNALDLVLTNLRETFGFLGK